MGVLRPALGVLEHTQRDTNPHPWDTSITFLRYGSTGERKTWKREMRRSLIPAIDPEVGLDGGRGEDDERHERGAMDFGPPRLGPRSGYERMPAYRPPIACAATYESFHNLSSSDKILGMEVMKEFLGSG